jgi:hypothetical protein
MLTKKTIQGGETMLTKKKLRRRDNVDQKKTM